MSQQIKNLMLLSVIADPIGFAIALNICSKTEIICLMLNSGLMENVTLHKFIAVCKNALNHTK